jgi:hypothetical protein
LPSSAGSGSSGSYSVFTAAFIAQEVDGVGDKRSGNTTRIDVQKILKAFFLNMSLRSNCFTDKAFSGKKYWDCSPQV